MSETQDINHVGVQDHLPAASVTALVREHPNLAPIAIPEAPRGSTDANEHPPKPSDIPNVQDQVTIPRGYIEYLENLVVQYTNDGTAPPQATPSSAPVVTSQPPVAESAAAVNCAAAAGVVEVATGANTPAQAPTDAAGDVTMHGLVGTLHTHTAGTEGVTMQAPHTAPTDRSAPPVRQQKDTPVATDQEMTDSPDAQPVLASGQGGVDARVSQPEAMAHAASV